MCTDLDSTLNTQSAPHKDRTTNASARHARRLLHRASTDLGETAEPITPAEPAGATLPGVASSATPPGVASSAPDPSAAADTPSSAGDRAGQILSDSAGQLPVSQSDTTAGEAPEATPQLRDSFVKAGPLRPAVSSPLDTATGANGASGVRGEDSTAQTSGEGVPESVQCLSAFAAAAAVRLESGGLDEPPAPGGTRKGVGSGEMDREGGQRTATWEQQTSLRKSRGECHWMWWAWLISWS